MTKFMYVYFSHYVPFTFSNVSRTLVICSNKIQVLFLTNLLCVEWEILITKGTDLAIYFCFYSDQYDLKISSLLAIQKFKTPEPNCEPK